MGASGKIGALVGGAAIQSQSSGAPDYTEILKGVNDTANWLDGQPVEIHVTGLCTAITTASTKMYGFSAEQSFTDLPGTFAKYPARTQPVTGHQRLQCAVASGSNRIGSWSMKAGRTAKVGDQVGIFVVVSPEGYNTYTLDDQATNKLFQVVHISEDDQDTANMPFCIAGGRVDVMVIASVSQFIAGQATATNP